MKLKIGAMLPHLGTGMSPAALVEAARRAEELGYDSLWAIERLLYPTNPRSPYPVTPDGSLPKMYARALTPIETLTYVAAHTTRIALGTGVLIMPLHNPVMLARQLATLDVLSGGRLRVGLGQGWSVDEIEAAGATTKGRAARADEFVEVLKAIWTTDPVQFAGEHFTLPRSTLQPKPIQSPHPPIYMAAYAPGGRARPERPGAGDLRVPGHPGPVARRGPARLRGDARRDPPRRGDRPRPRGVRDHLHGRLLHRRSAARRVHARA
jgi:probable F420-dependent oxidoreductase